MLGKKAKPIIGLFIVAIILTLGLTACSDDTDVDKLVDQMSPKAGYKAPNFELLDVKADTAKLKEYQGSPIVLNFWATWCGPCKEEMPLLEQTYIKHKDSGLVMLGMNNKEQSGTVSTYVSRGGYSWRMLLDYDGKIADIYRINAYPTTFFIDRNGYTRSIYVGGLTAEQLDKRIEKIMK
jgi:cytochrome c biogenesis protein CcmG, thiol:disulfide interchange protein DsbE